MKPVVLGDEASAKGRPVPSSHAEEIRAIAHTSPGTSFLPLLTPLLRWPWLPRNIPVAREDGSFYPCVTAGTLHCISA